MRKKLRGPADRALPGPQPADPGQLARRQPGRAGPDRTRPLWRRIRRAHDDRRRGGMAAAHTAVALGMAFHELATNAVKYGSLSGSEGWVSITWTVSKAGGGELPRAAHHLWRGAGRPAGFAAQPARPRHPGDRRRPGPSARRRGRPGLQPARAWPGTIVFMLPQEGSARRMMRLGSGRPETQSRPVRFLGHSPKETNTMHAGIR